MHLGTGTGSPRELLFRINHSPVGGWRPGRSTGPTVPFMSSLVQDIGDLNVDHHHLFVIFKQAATIPTGQPCARDGNPQR